MEENLCPSCQRPIPPDSPHGICGGCALLGVASPTAPSAPVSALLPALDEIAAAFPELEVLEQIGQGGMGVVYKARQPKLDRLVALKILAPALATQPGFAERFTREARALAKLSHPHIVGVHDFGTSGGFFYLLMEFVDGVNLRQAMRAGVSPEQALLLVPKVCEALQFAHDHGVLHRDIKPENILLDTRGGPKLADFGIAKLSGDASSGLTLSGAQLGTAAYMAPEQIEQPASVDHRADIYSLGVVLYEMLTGELPLGRFAAPSEKALCSGGVDDVVLRALEKRRERRQQSAHEMKTQVEAAGADAPATPHRVEKARAPWSRVAVAAAIVLVTSIPTAVAVVQLVREFHPHPQRFSVTVLRIAVFALPMGAVASVLGWVSVFILRASKHHVRGRGAAVACALAVPLYLPALVIIGNSYDVRGIIDRGQSNHFTPGSGLLVASVVVVVTLVVTIWLTRLVWRLAAPRGAAPSPPACPAPFSKVAAAGAWLTVGCLPFGVIASTLVRATSPLAAEGDTPLIFKVMPFASLPAFLGMVLGWKAVRDLRSHRHHLRGGGAAVLAALALPLAALLVSAARVHPLLALVVIAFGGWAVVRLWHSVHRGPPGTPVSSRPPAHRALRIAGVFVIIGGTAGAFALSRILPSHLRMQVWEERIRPAEFERLSDEIVRLSQEIARTEQARAEADRQLASFRSTFGVSHPAVVSKESSVRDLDEALQKLREELSAARADLAQIGGDVSITPEP